MRPLVALPSRRTETASSWRVPAVAVGRTYLDAIVRAGGQPVVLPPIDETITDLAHVLARFDAVVLPGGPDVDPARYGAAERHPTVRGVDASHDELDLALARTAVELGMPLLAICRGHQVLNVALGGTLVQHIGDVTEMEHLWVHHEVELHADGLTADAMGTRRPTGHSVHHQAIDRLGEGLVATGFAHDGTIEAVELPGRWVIGVQWHPEDTADDDPEQQRLFGAVVSAARASRS